MQTMFRSLVLSWLLVTLGACRGGSDSDSPPPLEAPPDVTGLGWVTGLDDAPVTVIEFSDFGCPYCAQFALDSYPVLHTEFVLAGQVRWIYVPFVIGRFPNAEGAAIAGECAGEQGRFWQMHDILFQNQARWRREGPSDELFYQFADSVGVDGPRFQECFRENRPGERIERHNALARQVGVRGTPSFLVNGRPVEGALPTAQFRTLLEYSVSVAR
jgi:protein-disulfide isomerase